MNDSVLPARGSGFAASQPAISHADEQFPAAALRRMRILLVAPQPFFELRGTPINVCQMIRALCGAGYEVHLVSYGLGTSVDIPGLVHHRSLHLPQIRQVATGFSAEKVFLDVFLAMRVWRLLLTHHFDVVHAIEESVFFTLPLARLRGVPVIYDLDSSIPDQLEYSGAVRNRFLLRIAHAAEAAALRHSQLAITVCTALTDIVRAKGAARVVQIEDAPLAESLREPDIAAVRRLREELGPGPFVVYTGNLSKYQGIDLLIDCLPELQHLCPSARLLIVGGDPGDVAHWRTIIEQRGVSHLATLTGAQPAESMPEYMSLASVLVSPRTAGTNTPLKLYTYMHSGTPIVATDIASHRQVLDETTAELCDPDPRALARGIARVLGDTALATSRAINARERVVQNFSPAHFTERLLGAYADLLAREGAS